MTNLLHNRDEFVRTLTTYKVKSCNGFFIIFLKLEIDTPNKDFIFRSHQSDIQVTMRFPRCMKCVLE